MIRRVLRLAILAFVVLLLLLPGKDTLHLGRTESTASSYLYGLVEWETRNFFSKWVHKLATSFPWASQSYDEKRAKLDRYFSVARQIGEIRLKIERAAAKAGQGASQETVKLESELARLVQARNGLRNDVEEFLESELSAVLKGQGLSSRLGVTFPPTDFRLEETPKLLVTSPRERIERRGDVLLKPGLSIEQMEYLEDRILKDQDLSALVVETGGLATYPATIPADQALRDTLNAAAHEWLHNYLFFKPMGQHFWDSPEMTSLNETVATIAGNELGRLACSRLVSNVEECSLPEEKGAGDKQGEDQGFSFNREMRTTRLRVEELLSESKVVEAEAYMEEQRRLFMANGFFIRKLNQAYFAFHGTYATAPASISPIGDQLKELRRLVPTVGDFVRTASQVSSYKEFLALLDSLRARSP